MKRLVVLLVALATLLPTGAHGAFPGRNGAIVYGTYSEDIISDVEGGSTFYDTWQVAMRLGGGQIRTIARCEERTDVDCHERAYSTPSFSPDGRRVAMSASGFLTMLDLDDGTSIRRPSFAYASWSPAFAPDGEHIAFTAAHARRTDVSILDLRTGRVRRVTSGARDPAWSTRGWIAFVRRGGIYRSRPDGHGQRLVVSGAYAPAWSPDGRRLAFARSSVERDNRVVRRGGVFVSDAAGNHLHRLTAAARYDDPFDAAWSPDGRRLLVAASSLTTVDLRGRLVRRLSAPGLAGASDVSVDWQPLP